MQLDPSKLAALRKALQTTGQFANLVSPVSIGKNPGNSTGISAPPTAPSKLALHYPPRSRPEPAEHKRIKIIPRKGKPGPAVKLSTVSAAAKEQHREAMADNGVLRSPATSASEPLLVLSPRQLRRQAQREADRLLAEQQSQLAAEQHAASLLNPDYKNILQEIAGYDPNELQDPNRPIFRPKAGGRPDKTQRRHTIAQIVESREEMAQTYSGRQRIQEREEANREALAEVGRKTGIQHLDFVHRPCPTPAPFVPAVSGTEDERRQRYGLPTLQDEVIAALDHHLNQPPPAAPSRLLVHNRYIPTIVSPILPETTWEMVTTETPIPAPSSIFDRNSTEYQSGATYREFENALNGMRFSNQWDAFDNAIGYVVQEASYA